MAGKTFAHALAKRRQISITVTGRRTGHPITIPVWFVFGSNAVWLLPVTGSKTQWYRNLKANRAIGIRVGSERHNLRARLRQDPKAVRKVIQSFRDQYTPPEIKRWYTGLDVAVQVPFSIAQT
jgi:deazaflavin-dependent oxidoreductase (nitroreductase family)